MENNNITKITPNELATLIKEEKEKYLKVLELEKKREKLIKMMNECSK